MYLVHLFVVLCLLKFSQCYVKVVALNGTSLQKIEDDYQEAELFINNKYFNKLSKGPSSVRKHLGNDSTTKSPKKSRKKNKNRKNSKCSGEFGRGCPKPVDTKDPPDIQIETEVFQIEDDAISRLFPDGIFNISRQPVDIFTSEIGIMQSDQVLRSSSAYGDRLGEKVGTASLTFVFDSTGSMWDDLTHVKIGAAKILDTMLERSNKPIYNFVLVPFRDPTVGPVTVTKDHKEFKEKLQEISVLGGADCPENTFAALYEAVNISEPGSYIYVFTDARSSDYDLYSEVSTLIQRKQSQVNFVMTGDCGDQNHPGYLAFDKIASMSSGVVYHLNKKEVDEVLNFVRLSLNSLKVNLFSVDNPNPTVGENHGIPIDKTLKEFTVSVAGLKPLVNIYNPQGRPSDVTPLLDLDHVKIVSVKDPEPGVWTVQISSDSQHSVRSTGLSSTDFVHGFALKPTTNIRNTYHRPLKGAKNSILVQTTEDKDSTQLSSVEVTAINGTVLARLPLKPTPNNDGVYSGGPFVPYDDPCFIAITGKKYDEEHTSYPFKRISPTAFSPQNPESPRIEMAAHQTEWIGSSAVLRCSVKSLVPFDVRWFKDGLVKSVNFHYEQSADVEFKIPNVTLASGGVYTCRANNIAGPASKKLRLQIKGLPPKVKAGLQKSGVSGQSVILTCSVTSSLPYNLTWLHVRSNFSSAQSRDIRNEARFITTTKNDLLISPVLPMDQGWYLCVANNSEGQSGSDKVMLTVQKKPQIKITSDTVEFKKNDDIVMSCFVLDGIPPPTLAWKKDGQFIKEETQETYFNNELDIHIIEAEQSDAGVYECQASNEVGVSSNFTVLSYVEEPQVFLEENEVLIRDGDNFSTVCHARGTPTPSITWLFANYTPIRTNDLTDKFQVQSMQELLIKHVGIQDGGVYICRGENKVGVAEAKVTLTVGSRPRIQPNMNVTQVNIGSNISLCCLASGYPDPSIHWRKLKPIRGVFKKTLNNTLTITDAKMEDGGLYMCQAENIFGVDTVMVDIEIVGLVPPVIRKDYSSATRKVLNGEDITLSCTIVEGNPFPKIVWFKDGRAINVWSKKIMNKGEQLVLENMNSQNVGNYECRASNVAGSDTNAFQIQLHEPPTIKEPWTSYQEVLEGSSVQLPCLADGDLTLTFSWSIEGKPLSDSNKWYVARNGSLIMNRVAEEDTNVYTCTVSNAVGSTSKTIQMNVLVPPFFKDEQQGNVAVVVNHPVNISCSHYGVPTPDFSWYKDDSLLRSHSQYITLGSQVNDSGLYSCYVKNKAGEINRKVKLTILVPPVIKKDYSAATKKVIDGEVITLSCTIIEGNPFPKIVWTKDGRPINVWSKTLNNGEQLVLENMNSQNVGNYECRASNVAGSDTNAFHIQLHESPTLKEPWTSYQEVLEGSSVQLPCLAEGELTLTFSWSTDGKPINSSSKWYVARNGSLIMNHVTEKDTNAYTCTVSNAAGSTSKTIQMNVLVPPFFKDEQQENVPVVVNHPVNISCSHYGVPTPDFSWYKDDRILRSHSQYITLGSQVNDGGLYSCYVKNKAGEINRKVNLTVLVPPVINKDHSSTRKIIDGDVVTLSCTIAQGYPFPKIVWLKDGKPINVWSKLLNKGEQLVLENMNSQNVGNYECRASNVAGSDTNAFQIQLHEPPTIKEPWTSYQEVLEGSSVQLPCLAEGELTPTYSWSAEGKPINNSNRWYVTRNGSFVINNIAEKDTNVYTCTVSNAAGSTSKTIQMNVLVPPFFKDEQQESVAIVVNHPMNISCSHYGVPTPDFSWYKDGSLLRIQSHYITLGSQVNDSGLYSCYVKNKAGEINRKVNLTVLATPVIEKDNSPATRKVINGENITLNCTIAQGYPIPKIVWFKDGRPISAWFKLLNKGEQLVLENMNSQNVGNYECRASNIAGSDTNAFHIQLHEPPTIKEPWTSYQEVLEGSSVQLPCLAEGDLTLTFSWSAEGKPINDSSKWYVARNGSLIMSHVSEEDTNAYTCTVSNAVGSTSKTIQMNVLVPPFFKDEQQENVAVVVNHPVNISCSHYGVPTPDFIWYKDDTLLRIESLYITLGSQVNDRGVYSCYVKNKAGEISRKINMTVLEPPSIHRDSQEKITVVQGNSVGLICNASGYPTPKISWNSSVAALEENSQISFTGNELRLFNVTANMSGKITCDAENAVGVDHKTFELEVTVPPKIQENGISPNLTLKEGEVFSIPCIATGNPDPQISWHIQSKSRTIHSGYHEDNMLVLTDNTLVLTEVSANDTYTCVASNSAGIDKKNYSITIEENPIYVTDPEVEQVNVMESDTVQMECDVDEDTPVDHWLINGKPIPKIIKIERGDEIHFSYSEDKHVLSVLNVPDSSFNGIYQCVDETGKVIKSFKLNVLSTPQFDSDASFKSDIIVEQGSKVSMNCSANGFPKPLVTWKKISPTGELPVTEHTVPDIIFEPPQFNYVLHFPSVQTKHSGLYQCTAANDIEQSDDYRVSRQFNLQVLEPPFIRNKPATDLVQIEQNSELKLSCDVEGNPTPEIMWHRAGAQIDSSAVKEVVPPDEGINTFRIISTLSIPNIQTEQRGEFACIASNKIGVAEQSFHVTVNAT